jgi:cytosine/adenosine deaminase-related metal-dependent hydrolase
MDLILRNARLTSRPGQTLFDIGIEGGRIAAIEPTLQAEGQETDVQGRLVNAGFVETHIHLDKSSLLDRCHAVKGNIDEAIAQVAAVKKQFTVADVRTARLMRRDDYGVEVGKSADLVVLDCQDRESAVAEVVTPLYGFKRGRPTFTRRPAELHRP